MVIQAFRFALDPTVGQQAALRSHCGGQRFAFNWGLARIKANLDQRAAEKTYDIPDDQLTPSVSWSAYSQRKDWNQAKDVIAPWWAENSKEAYSSGLANLAAALGNWAGCAKGMRRGPRLGFPRFKGRRSGLSCRFTTGVFGLADDRRHVKLPRIGLVRAHESTRKLARHVTRTDAAPGRPGSVVGVDLGVKSLAVLSTGETIPNPRHLETALREPRRLQRQVARRTGPDRRTRQEPTVRWRKTQARVTRLHTEIANARRDGPHKLTTRLIRTHGVVVIEDLNVAGMMRNRCPARHIAGVGMAELRRQIEYKAGWAGVRLLVADRWYPSSKTCSGCGVVKAKLRLSERTFRCDACGLVCDRDLNAARNLAALVHREMSSPSCGATQNEPAGNPGKTRTTRATGTATGRPAPPRYGSTPTRRRAGCLNTANSCPPTSQVTEWS